jgi:glycerate kinase
MSRILIAPDSFKGSATSIEVASAIAQGWKSRRPEDELIQIPFADGGEGSLLTIEFAQPAAQRIYCPEVSPHAYWLLLDGSTAVVELAQVCGITLLSKLDPMGAHTFALGQVLAHAARDERVKRIYCALGGSASSDGGVGALMALGVKFYNSAGNPIGLGGEQLAHIETISTDLMLAPPKDGVVLLVDVNSPLLGAHGAAATFAPQKGATQQQVHILENALSHFASKAGVSDSPGSGAAGGSSYGLHALWGARIENGAAKISDLCGIDAVISSVDLVITGEGRLDSQSFQGKVVGHLTQLAAAAHVPIAYCVGTVDGDFPAQSLGGVSLVQIAGSYVLAKSNPEKYLIEAGVQLTRLL